jgi:hypothetical protein
MKVHGLGIWCLQPISMLQMMTKFTLGDYKCECERRLSWFNSKKPLLGLKSLKKGGKSENIFNLQVGCDIQNWKNSWKKKFLVKSLCLKKFLNLKMP